MKLKGTEKQVAWAESIRKWVGRMFDDAKANTDMIPQFTDEHLEAFNEAEKIIMANGSAKFWIETFGPHIQPRNLEGLQGRELMGELAYYADQVSPVVAKVTRDEVKEKGMKTKGTRGIDLATRYYRKMRNEL